MDRMAEWITTGERPLPFYVRPFAKSASGGSSNDDDSDDEEDDEEDDDEDADEDADKSDEELREELKKTRAALSKRTGDSKRQLKRRRELERQLEEARKPKPKKKTDDDDDAPDLDTIRHEAKTEGEKAGILRAKKAEAKSALLAAGVSPERVGRLVGMLDLDELDLDDDGLDGIDDAIDDLRKDVPEFFAKKRTRRESVAGERDRDGAEKRRKPKTASEQAADKLLRRSA